MRTAFRIASVPMRPERRPTSTPSSARSGPGGVALSGHVDTVPVDGQAWSADPFTLRRAEGRLYARGSADMKGFVSACLAAVPDIKSRNLARPLHLFISYDEEVGCHGAQRLIQDLDESGLKPALCVVGEPSGMQPILAHKGKLNLRVTGARADRAFQRTRQGRQRDPGRRRGGRLRRRRSASAGEGRPVRGGVRSAAHHDPCRHHPGRHDSQHHSGALRIHHGVAHHPRR